MSFNERVWKLTKRIPKGKVSTYWEIARALGKPGAARAVGNALNKNRDPKVPCHRVVRADGKTGGFARGIKEKERLLRAEGVEVKKGKIDLSSSLFRF